MKLVHSLKLKSKHRSKDVCLNPSSVLRWICLHQAVSQNPVNDFWGGFGSMMDNNPEDAWKYLSQAPQGAMQTKMLVQDL